MTSHEHNRRAATRTPRSKSGELADTSLERNASSELGTEAARPRPLKQLKQNPVEYDLTDYRGSLAEINSLEPSMRALKDSALREMAARMKTEKRNGTPTLSRFNILNCDLDR